MKPWLCVLFFIFLFTGCQGAPVSHPSPNPADTSPGTMTLPVPNAIYVGDAPCLLCHPTAGEHWGQTTHARIFRSNPQNSLQEKMCEACHGPGSEHAKDPKDKTKIVAFTRDAATSVRDQTAACQKCHKGKEVFFWEGSVHQANDLSCSDCHNPMATFSQTGLLRDRGISETCYNCHRRERMEFRKRSHMPLPEGKVSCADCHNPHGTYTRPLLKADTLNQVCYRCHAEKRGPFLWEHQPVRENCGNCHLVHGSNHEKLLMVTRPFLCQQCHSQLGHPNDLLTSGNLANGARPDARIMNRSCQNCHTQIHGSNHSSGVRFHR